MGFTVHRPPCGEVSLCWYRPSGGDVAGRVHVGVARPRIASDAREDRLALAVFGRDVPAGGASLRRVRGWDPFKTARSLVVEPGNQPTPPLTTNGAIEAPLLRNPNTRLVNRAAGRAGHRAHVERLDSNGVEPVCQIGCGLLDPVAPAVGFARFKSRDGQPGARSAVGAPFLARQALLQPAQPNPLTPGQARNTHQLSSGQCCRDCHSAINTDHAAVPRAQDRVRDVGEGDMPTPGPIASDAVGLHTRRYGPGPAEADPANFGHPNPSIAFVELLNVARLETDLPEAFMHPSFAPRRTPMGAGEDTPHGLREVPQRLLLHCLRPGRQPVVLGTNLSQLRALFVVSRGTKPWLPKLLLFHGQVPNKPGMPAMLQQHHLLERRRQQPKPRHIRNVTVDTDTNGHRTSAQFWVGFRRRRKCPDFSKEWV